MLLLILALLTLPLSIQSLSILCAGNLYGKPRPADALALSKSLPYMKSDPDGDMDKVRIFAEPEFFTPRFHGLVNRWETDMVQLPRVWRYRTARLSLLLYANPHRAVPIPAINGNWRTVQAAARGILQYCVQPSPATSLSSSNSSSSSSSTNPSSSSSSQQKTATETETEETNSTTTNNGAAPVGGVWIIADPVTQTPYMSLFLYASGSPFEDVLNGYMISGRGVNPFNPEGWPGGVGVGGTVNGNGSVVGGGNDGVGMEGGGGVVGVQGLSGAVVSAVEGVKGSVV